MLAAVGVGLLQYFDAIVGTQPVALGGGHINFMSPRVADRVLRDAGLASPQASVRIEDRQTTAAVCEKRDSRRESNRGAATAEQVLSQRAVHVQQSSRSSSCGWLGSTLVVHSVKREGVLPCSPRG